MFNENKIELNKLPEVTLRLPDGDKGFMFEFTSKTEGESEEMNYIISTVVNERVGDRFGKLFHQVGSGNEKGYHGWELFTSQFKFNRGEFIKEDLSSIVEEINSSRSRKNKDQF